MGKFQSSFMKAAREDLEREAEQKRLHEKHQEVSEQTVIIEKDNMIKFTIRMITKLIRLTATITILILAAIGLISMVYPQIRSVLVEVLLEILRQAQNMVGK